MNSVSRPISAAGSGSSLRQPLLWEVSGQAGMFWISFAIESTHVVLVTGAPVQVIRVRSSSHRSSGRVDKIEDNAAFPSRTVPDRENQLIVFVRGTAETVTPVSWCVFSILVRRRQSIAASM